MSEYSNIKAFANSLTKLINNDDKSVSVNMSADFSKALCEELNSVVDLCKPMKPKKDGKWSFCPRCKEGVGFRESALVSAFEYSIDFQPFYCPNCGQRIDWL